MKKVMLFIALFMVTAMGAAQAQSLANELFETQNTRETLVDALELQYNGMQQSGQLNLDDVHAMSEELVDAIYDRLKEVTVNFYSENYTNDEIKALIEFYKSPVGQKTLKLTAKASSITTAVTQEPEMVGKMSSIVMKHMKL